MEIIRYEEIHHIRREDELLMGGPETIRECIVNYQGYNFLCMQKVSSRYSKAKPTYSIFIPGIIQSYRRHTDLGLPVSDILVPEMSDFEKLGLEEVIRNLSFVGKINFLSLN